MPSRRPDGRSPDKNSGTGSVATALLNSRRLFLARSASSLARSRRGRCGMSSTGRGKLSSGGGTFCSGMGGNFAVDGSNTGGVALVLCAGEDLDRVLDHDHFRSHRGCGGLLRAGVLNGHWAWFEAFRGLGLRLGLGLRRGCQRPRHWLAYNRGHVKVALIEEALDVRDVQPGNGVLEASRLSQLPLDDQESGHFLEVLRSDVRQRLVTASEGLDVWCHGVRRGMI